MQLCSGRMHEQMGRHQPLRREDPYARPGWVSGGTAQRVAGYGTLRSGRSHTVVVQGPGARRMLHVPSSTAKPCHLRVRFEGSGASFGLRWDTTEGPDQQIELHIVWDELHGPGIALLDERTSLRVREATAIGLRLYCEPSVAFPGAKLDLQDVLIQGGLAFGPVEAVKARGADSATLEATLEDGRLVLRKARAVELVSESWAEVELDGDAQDLRLDQVQLTVTQHGHATDLRGLVRLAACHGSLCGDSAQPLRLDSFLGSGKDGALADARLSGFELPAHNLRRFLSACAEAVVVDPTVSSIRSVAARGQSDRLVVAEELYDAVLGRAERPSTVAAAGYQLLEARRRAFSPRSLDRWLLNLFRCFGYGRQLMPPAALWGGVLLAVSLWRLATALQDPSGLLGWHRPVGDPGSWLPVVTFAADFALSLVLLPAATFRPENLPALGMTGGYLLLVRVLCTVCVAAIVAGLRNRVRLTPKET